MDHAHRAGEVVKRLRAAAAWRARQLALFSLAGWLVVLARPDQAAGLDFCGSAGRYWLAVAGGDTSAPSPGWLFIHFAPTWLLMLWSCMPLLVIPELRHLRTLGKPSRRWRSAMLFALGYVAIWMGAGVAGLAVAAILGAASDAWQIPPVLTAALVAVDWHMSRARRRCLGRCHQAPHLMVSGLRADAAALRYGEQEGAWCVGGCWHLMMAPLLVPQGHLLTMALCTAAMLAQRNEGWFRIGRLAAGHGRAP